MRVIGFRKLREFFGSYPDAEISLSAWYKLARRANWQNLAEVKQTYSHANLVGDYSVFNLRGNNYRLVVRINFRTGVIYVKGVFSHAEYDKGAWKT
ncbi:MAG: type II toxin-antitoxin system HigB family toxin [Pyrinomonadaceae bacterium]